MEVGRIPQLPFRNSVHLTTAEACQVMRSLLSGEMDTAGIAELLRYLQRKGETVAELVGFASAMRDMAHLVHLDQSDEPVLDTCGTGGDGVNTFNISTATAFVAAGAGLREQTSRPVAHPHGVHRRGQDHAPAGVVLPVRPGTASARRPCRVDQP